MRFLALVLALAGLAAACHGAASRPLRRGPMPRYAHIFVIVEENKDYDEILDPFTAPNISGLARRYGLAGRFYAEVHPSEANYVAMLAGDTFGIRDDDAFNCRAGDTRPACPGATAPGYPDHTIHARHLGDQLEAAGLAWKGYYENLPAPGSLAINATDPAIDDGAYHSALYASKHSGFLNFADVQADPARARKIVGFDQLNRDLASGQLPAFALVIPNQCNEMHGVYGPRVPAVCSHKRSLIRRGDAIAGELVRRIQATGAWRSAANVAIVITFDEGSKRETDGCCGADPGSGHIPTVVITNHGPRGVVDPTPYNHYSLLRTFEEAFGLADRLGHAGDTAHGVVAMTPLFATAR